MVLLEVCANSFESARNAELGGAHRIELCQNLEQGGITPSFGLIKQCKDQLKIPIHVLIRPRPGHFVYEEDEYQVMLNDVQVCKQLGCAGVVVGILTAEGKVDVQRCLGLLEAATGMDVTFHRAFDDCTDQFDAMEDIMRLGCTRILTSGGCKTAPQGSQRLAQLNQRGQGRIIVLAGSGITPENVVKIIRETGVREVHASASVIQEQSRVDSLFTANQRTTSKTVVEELMQQLRLVAD